MPETESAVRVAVTGALGRMGALLASRVIAEEGLTLVGATERHDHPQIAKDVGRLLGLEPCEVSLENDLRNAVISAQVIIDFTQPESALRSAQIAAEFGIALVLGTTGFSDKQRDELYSLIRSVPCVHAPNFAVGVNLMLKLVERTARTLGPDWDVEIVEAHHRQKRDAPSGTALALARAAACGQDSLPEDVVQYGRPRGEALRAAGEIGVHAVRAGQITGEHTVLFAGPNETLRIEHCAQSRELFVDGALLAARWLIGRDPGVYSMFDVLELY
ncbi:MAG: 4-hydroxy-tetrahydrodipicolinate reductase [Candidatus Alcyoniella australis]|nr:4-hydroxy-tetrahydrodipicolinate reductase [Candidatus Alcyoniella australis]